MSHQDKKSDREIVVNHESLRQVINWLIRPALFVGLTVRQGSTWKPRMLAAAALFWAVSDHASLTDRFQHVRKIIRKIFHWQPHPGSTYQGFIKVLGKWHERLFGVIASELRLRIEQTLDECWEIAGFVVFAVDGSRVELPRTRSNEQAYSARRKSKRAQSRKGKGKRKRNSTKNKPAAKRRKMKKQSAKSIQKKTITTQIWLTLLWHVGSGLPWAWRSGPSDSSERGHLEEMLAELPENSLITADAGFVGYDFWKAILDAGQSFVIRVGANVRLLKELGYAREYDHVVYLWPDQAARKKMPPLVLRLVVVHDGKHPVYLVTNVMTKKRLSDQQVVQIYRRRWGIELFFRTFKQTFGRQKLRSKSAENARLELDWSLLALWSICLFGQQELVEAGEDPTQLSPAGAIKAFQTTMREYRSRPEESEASLWALLCHALLDDYDRTSSKASRDYPTKKKRERTGAPKVNRASKMQINAAKELKETQLVFRLTA